MMSGSSESSLGRTSGVGYPKTTSFNPRSLLKRHPPPVAAHLRTPNCPPGLDLSRPLLIYSSYVSTKIRAISLRLYRDGSLERVGPPLVIPDAYTGWFAIISSDGSTAPCFSTVEQVVSANLSFFLTRYDAPAYVIIENDIGITSYKRTLIQGGNVLKLLGVFEDFSSRITECPSKFFGCQKYAQCQDFNNQVVYLPLNISGKFYSTGQKLTSRSFSNVYLISHLIKNFKFPLTVKLVCGYMPRAPCSFTGLLRLERSQKEEVMLACTMTSEAHATLFEIEVDSNFIFTPITDQLFPKTPIYLKTISYCQDEADSWQRQIKVTHHVIEKRSSSLSRSVSEKFVEPLHCSKSFNLALMMDSNRKRNTKEKPLKERIEDSISRQYAKRNLKKTDKRKLRSTKHDPYVFQLIRRHRSLSGMTPPVQSSRKNLSVRLTQSFDNLNYCRVLDDISNLLGRKRHDLEEEEEEDHYTTIGESTISEGGEINENFSSHVNDDETTNAKIKLNTSSETKGNRKSESDFYNNNAKEIFKKDSIDSGTYADFDESYFSMDYGEVDAIHAEDRNEKVIKDPCPSNFVLGKTKIANLPTNLLQGMSQESITVSFSNYSDSGTKISLSNGIHKKEAVERTASLNAKTITPVTNDIKNHDDGVRQSKSLEVLKNEVKKKVLNRSISLLNGSNSEIPFRKLGIDVNKEIEKSFANRIKMMEQKTKKVTGKNSIAQSTNVNDDNVGGNSASRKDEYLIDGEDVSVISIEMSSKSDAFQRSPVLNQLKEVNPHDDQVSDVLNDRKSIVNCRFTADKDTSSSKCFREGSNLANANEVYYNKTLMKANELVSKENDKEGHNIEVKLDLEDTKKVKAGEEKMNPIIQQENGGIQTRSGDNYETTSPPSDTIKKIDEFEVKNMIPGKEVPLGSRILMRGNTVVIRVKDAEPKRPRISDKTFEGICDDQQESPSKIDCLPNNCSFQTNHDAMSNRGNDIPPATNIKRNVSTVKINKSDPCNNAFVNTDIGSPAEKAFPISCNEEIELSSDVSRAKCEIINQSNNENSLEREHNARYPIRNSSEHNKTNKIIETNHVINTTECNKRNFKINDVCEGNYTKVITNNNCKNDQYNSITCNGNNDYDMTSLTNTPFSVNDSNFPENNILHNFDVRRLNNFKMSNDISRKEESLIIKNSGNIKFSTITELSDKCPILDWSGGNEKKIRNNNTVKEENDLMKDTSSKSDSALLGRVNSTISSCQHTDDGAHILGILSKDPVPPTKAQRNSFSDNSTKSDESFIPSSEAFVSSSTDDGSNAVNSGLIEAKNLSICADQFGVVVLTLTSNGFFDAEKKFQRNNWETKASEKDNQSEC